MFFFLVVLLIILFIVFVLDCDIFFKFKEKFGEKLENKLCDKVVWIMGVFSGIGEYLVLELVKCGCYLVLLVRRKEELERVKEVCFG